LHGVAIAFHVPCRSAYWRTAADAVASVVVVVEFLGSVVVGDLDFVACVLLFAGVVVVVVVVVAVLVDVPDASFRALCADWISESMELMSLW
jgi:hypothetical protein